MKALFILLFSSFIALGVEAQMIEDPTTWSFEVKKKNANDYTLIFHVSVKTGWHIWSVHPGGDGSIIAPTFVFEKNSMLTVKGSVAEKGKPFTTQMDGIEGKVTFLSDKVDYTQEVSIAGKGKIKGNINYQVCSDKMCLPPKDKGFVFDIK